MDISTSLIRWYQRNKRDLPWRNTTDPYRIWLSEIILQQTRVEQGTPYYYRFLSAFPTIHDLAEADENQVLKLWQGLGYYSRARNLHRAARVVESDFGGLFPVDFNDIISLPGIGEYTASAVASFAFNQPYAVVDGNVNRVISRIFGINDPINSSGGQKIFKELATALLSRKEPGLHNQAIMEFGARYCKPQTPDCELCIFASKCNALLTKRVNSLPVKIKSTKIKVRHFNYLLIRLKDHTYLRKRKGKGIWQHLFELPCIETNQQVSLEDLVITDEWKQLFGKSKAKIRPGNTVRIHKLTHQHIRFNYCEVILQSEPHGAETDQWLKIHIQDIDHYPVPKPMEYIFKEAMPGYGGN